jgi:hypothetical protein
VAKYYHRVADDSEIPKPPVINPQKALVHQQSQKTPAWIVNPQNPTSQNMPFFLFAK